MEFKIFITKVYFCPHHPYAGSNPQKCECRKPKPGMFNLAKDEYDIDLERSFMIGDKITDKLAAKKAKIKFFYKKEKNLNTQMKIILK